MPVYAYSPARELQGFPQGASVAVGMVKLRKVLETHRRHMILMHILGSIAWEHQGASQSAHPLWVSPGPAQGCQSTVASQEANRAHFIFSWCNFSGSCSDTPGVPITCSSAT